MECNLKRSFVGTSFSHYVGALNEVYFNHYQTTSNNECKTVALHIILMCIIWPGSANVDLAYYCVLIKKFLRKWIYRLVGHPVQTCAVFTPKHGSECYTFFNLIMRFCNRYTQADIGKIINKTTINYGHNII